MGTSKNFSRRTSVLILFLLAATTHGCGSFAARASSSLDSKESFSGRGLRITEVWPGSPAERAGLKEMDIIFRYGDVEVVDDASFFSARDTYEYGRERGIPLVIWRAPKALRVVVPPGRLGINTVEYSQVAFKLSSFLMKLDAQRQIPEYQRDREFKDSYTPPEKIVAEARGIIDQAERELTLTPNQIRVARINLIPDDASPEDLKQQSELLAELIATQPASYLYMLGNDQFFKNRHYRPAIECLKRHLEVHPDDVSMRLNLSFAYSHLGMYREAEAAADYVVDHELGLSEHGEVVFYGLKAMSTLSRGDYGMTIALSEKAFELEQNHFDIARVMLAAAQSGDLRKFAEALHKYEEVLPAEFAQRKLSLTAVEALALVRSNQRDRARELVSDWKDTDRIEGRLKAYWKNYPGGSDVWTNWNELSKN
jgi:tetratricopeptide (TPR) repeat protein